MSDFAQYAAFGAAVAREQARQAQPLAAPVRIPGLDALGRSSHGGAPLRGSVFHAPAAPLSPTPSLDTDDVAA